jgi:murein L,D-transpeptidase YafK
LQLKMERLAMSESDPIFMRIFKQEGELEVWKRGPSGRYMLLESYEICTWSGELGPKFQEGDRQAPEGFYTITPAQMNPTPPTICRSISASPMPMTARMAAPART